MRILALLLLFLVAARNEASFATVWIDAVTSAAVPTVQHGILRSVETGAVPATSVLMSRQDWRAAHAAALASAIPPTSHDRAMVRASLGNDARKWWDAELIGQPEQDAVIEAFRIAPPW